MVYNAVCCEKGIKWHSWYVFMFRKDYGLLRLGVKYAKKMFAIFILQ